MVMLSLFGLKILSIKQEKVIMENIAYSMSKFLEAKKDVWFLYLMDKFMT